MPIAFDNKCTVCEKEFKSRKEGLLYCSPACRQKAYRTRNKVKEPKRCPVCKGEFMPVRKSHEYCSPACRQKAYRARMSPAYNIRLSDYIDVE